MSCFVSVIIPAYNAARTISDAIRSVHAANSGFIREIVVVDDGSTDRTAEIATSLHNRERHSLPVRIIRHPCNRGGGSARNRAVMEANNDILLCLDADNILDARSTRKALAMFTNSTDLSAVAFASIRYFAAKPGDKHSWSWDYPDAVLADCLRDPRCPPVASGNFLFTRHAWQLAGGYPEYAGSLDAWGFGARLLDRVGPIRVARGTHYEHRLSPTSYYARDTNENRRIASGQILLELCNRLTPESRNYLLHEGHLLTAFEKLAKHPLSVTNAPEGRVLTEHSAQVRNGLVKLLAFCRR
jgi:glycosyltransferase involved in cell wall biosynthesis